MLAERDSFYMSSVSEAGWPIRAVSRDETELLSQLKSEGYLELVEELMALIVKENQQLKPKLGESHD